MNGLRATVTLEPIPGGSTGARLNLYLPAGRSLYRDHTGTLFSPEVLQVEALTSAGAGQVWVRAVGVGLYANLAINAAVPGLFSLFVAELDDDQPSAAARQRVRVWLDSVLVLTATIERAWFLPGMVRGALLSGSPNATGSLHGWDHDATLNTLAAHVRPPLGGNLVRAAHGREYLARHAASGPAPFAFGRYGFTETTAVFGRDETDAPAVVATRTPGVGDALYTPTICDALTTPTSAQAVNYRAPLALMEAPHLGMTGHRADNEASVDEGATWTSLPGGPSPVWTLGGGGPRWPLTDAHLSLIGVWAGGVAYDWGEGRESLWFVPPTGAPVLVASGVRPTGDALNSPYPMLWRGRDGRWGVGCFVNGEWREWRGYPGGAWSEKPAQAVDEALCGCAFAHWESPSGTQVVVCCTQVDYDDVRFVVARRANPDEAWGEPVTLEAGGTAAAAPYVCQLRSGRWEAGWYLAGVWTRYRAESPGGSWTEV